MNETTKNSYKNPIALLVAGTLFLLGPLWGMLGTVIGMVRAFATLDGNNGTETSEALASDVGFALWTTVIGFAVTPIGLILVAIGIFWIVSINKHNDALA